MVVQEDTVFVSGMDSDINEDDIANHFGAIGIIKVILDCFSEFTELITTMRTALCA